MQTHVFHRRKIGDVPHPGGIIKHIAKLRHAGRYTEAREAESNLKLKLASMRSWRRHAQGDVWHGLVNLETGSVEKFSAMTEVDAISRNRTVRDLGYEWRRMSPPLRA